METGISPMEIGCHLIIVTLIFMKSVQVNELT